MDDSTDLRDHDGASQPDKRLKRLRDEEQIQDEHDSNSQEFGIMRGSYDPKQGSRFVGSSSGIHFIRTVYGMLAGKSELTPASEDTTSPAVPGEDDELLGDRPEPLTGSAKGSTPDTNLWSRDEIALGEHGAPFPSFEDLINWTKTYFENWHPIFPFLHAPTILDIFDRVSNSGLESVTPADRTIVRALVSMGIADGRQATAQLTPPPSEFVFLNVNQVMLDVQFAICQPATLHNLQALFSTQLFLVSMLKFNFASRIGGTVVRMAFHLGLHRCPSRFHNFSAPENQLRRRMFFCVYCLDRILCQSLGLPLGISDTDVDVCYPGEEFHGPSAREQPHIHGKDKQLLTLSMFARHARIRGMILELRNKALHSRHETAKRALRIEMELSKWSNLLHELVEETSGDEESNDGQVLPISGLHRMYLLLLEHESTIALNRPLITANKSSTDAMSALQNCIRAARSIITILDEYRSANSSKSQGDMRLKTPVSWPLVTWCCWMSFFILAFAALEGQLKKQFAVKYAERSLKILNHLSLRKTRWPDLCADAVKHVRIALINSPVRENGTKTPHTERSSPSRHGRQPSPRKSNSRTIRHRPPERPTSNDTLMSATSRMPMNDALVIQQSPWSLPQYSLDTYPADSPDSFDAHTGRFGNPNLSSTTLDYGMNGMSQSNFDPFSAIDFSNFTMTNFNFMNDFGS